MNHNEYITTGFPTLDEAIGGFRPAELTIIGGQPAMGKSSLPNVQVVQSIRLNFD